MKTKRIRSRKLGVMPARDTVSHRKEISMPRLQNIDEGIYTCPKCKQTVCRKREDFDTTPRLRAMFKGKLPAYLLCGRCFSAHPHDATPLMWRTDVKPQDRKRDLWGVYGSRASGLSEGKQSGYKGIKDVSFGKCRRFVAYPITERVITDSGELLTAAECEVGDVKLAKGKLNSVAVHFSTSEEHAVKGQHYAVIDWAPNGVWGDADTVKPGFYKTHKYTIIRQHQTKKEG